MELEPRHGCSRETARRGHADELREPVRHRVSLECPDDARRHDEDRGDGGKRELKAGVEERIRVPAQEDRRADEQCLPPVALAAGQPGKRSESRGECRSHHRRMEPDGKCVRRHRGQCSELGHVDPKTEEQDDGHGAAADSGDLQPIDGETVIEARGPEVREQALVDA